MNCILVFGFFYPEKSVSAQHFTDLAEGLRDRGINVTVLTSNYTCRENEKINEKSDFKGIKVIRSWRPSFLKASSNIGRILISFFISISHFFRILFGGKIDIVVFGTNPEFEFFIIPFLRFFRPKIKYSIYGFDIYPEAISASKIKIPIFIYKLLYYWAGVSYRSCDLLIDIGSCMRKLFEAYKPAAKKCTIVPWAFVESSQIECADLEIRKLHFGNAKLGILYSGTVGVVHRFQEVLVLARELRKRNASVAFCFAGYGNKYDDLKKQVTKDDTNISFAGFIDAKDLGKRLTCSDISLVTLDYGFEGISVPSKFFGAIAVGQPILYAGTPNSSLADIVKNNGIGFCLFKDNVNMVVDKIEYLSKNPQQIQEMKERAISLYKNKFSKEIAIGRFCDILKTVVYKNK